MTEFKFPREYYVTYSVRGFDGRYRAGPYHSYLELGEQVRDIEGYEGVYDVRVEE